MIQRGDVGTLIRLETGMDLGPALEARVFYRTPSGATGSWAASAVGTEVQYTTGVADFTEAGQWAIRAFARLPSFEGYGRWVGIMVVE